jgi:hypothetical protein
MRFEVLTAVEMSVFVSLVMTPCGLVSGYQRFGGCSNFIPEDGGSIFL